MKTITPKSAINFRVPLLIPTKILIKLINISIKSEKNKIPPKNLTLKPWAEP
jgi:hypothetical protein